MKQVKCPDCLLMIEKDSIRSHIMGCKSYKPRLFENTSKLADHLNVEYLQFLITQIDMAKEVLQRKVDSSLNPQVENHKNWMHVTQSLHTQKMGESQEPLDLQELFDRKSAKKPSDKKNSINNAKRDVQVHPKREQQDTLKMKEEDIMSCTNCLRKIEADAMSEIVFIEPCQHIFCRACIASYIEDLYVQKNGVIKCLSAGCKNIIGGQQIREIVGRQVFQKMQNKMLRQMMNLVICCKCKQQFQFAKGNARDAPKKDDLGKKLLKKYAQHFAQNRFVCSNQACKQQQCKSCKSAPYHLGRTCEQNIEFKQSKKCRYCNEVLPKGYISSIGIKTFDDICESKQCKKIAKNACSKILKCKHPCMGYIKEQQCLPCLKEECTKGKVAHGQDQNSFCSICYIEDLKSSPCVMSKCGHIFHYACLQKRLKIRWLTPRILFNFCLCPLCKQWIALQQKCPLAAELKKNQELFDQIKKKAILRLKNQKLDKDKRILDKQSEFYEKPTEYALAIYAYFECNKCKKPYFGGKKSCADAMDNNAADNQRGEQFDAQKLICAQCCPIPTKDCPTHGKQFISFKCKFCCNISQWFCWGNTHFCDLCHKKQLQGQYVSKIPKDKLPKCEGPGKCPSGGKHPQNGVQHNLGCFVCRNYKEHHQDDL